uniref:Transposase putative n=1 Tax=Albugo laibachii Nc14 TaxID=890382 RepID=F0WAC3_9STRA|nr:transposase putative [Albugo laibachii Nc14]|eukprot:CCA18094.1 transposase putative [Albugo laibachii Nc14]
MANLSDEKHRFVVDFLLKASSDGVLQHGDVSSAAAHFHFSPWAIARVLRRYSESLSAGSISGRVEGKSREEGYDKAPLLARIQTLSHSKRTKIRTRAAAVGISLGVVQRLLKTNAIASHTNKIMPSLTDANKNDRVRFAVSHVSAETLVFDSMHDLLHIDEKWFNEDVDKHVYYFPPRKQPPQRRRQSKRFIGKTMFLAEVTRSRCEPLCILFLL